jgi:hypothetical protein
MDEPRQESVRRTDGPARAHGSRIEPSRHRALAWLGCQEPCDVAATVGARQDTQIELCRQRRAVAASDADAYSFRSVGSPVERSNLRAVGEDRERIEIGGDRLAPRVSREGRIRSVDVDIGMARLQSFDDEDRLRDCVEHLLAETQPLVGAVQPSPMAEHEDREHDRAGCGEQRERSNVRQAGHAGAPAWT